ncbi:MAG: hypothetical protein ACK4MV_10980 [Beijerinckiaceae bacterium]
MSNEPATLEPRAVAKPPPAPAALELVQIAPPPSPLADAAPTPSLTLQETARRYWLFLSLVVAPIILSIFYFGFIASDTYVSEAKFVIRAPSSADSGSLGMLMRGETGNRTADETNAVNAYMMSRDAVAALARDNGLRDVMSRKEGDLFARYPNFYTRQNDEQLFRAYKRFVNVDVDGKTGISTLSVRAFRPEDAKGLAEALLARGESFVNTLRERSARDEVAFAQSLVAEARARMEKAAADLAAYRNQESTVNPEAESTSALAALTKLATEIAQLEAALAQQIAMAPQSPTIAPLREKVRSLRDELDRQRRLLVGDPDSMAAKFKGYELLVLEREIAAKTLIAAVVQMERARQEAQKQTFYLQRIVEPNQPDYPSGPYRILGILAAIALSLGAYWMAQSLLRQIMDHRP